MRNYTNVTIQQIINIIRKTLFKNTKLASLCLGTLSPLRFETCKLTSTMLCPGPKIWCGQLQPILAFVSLLRTAQGPESLGKIVTTMYEWVIEMWFFYYFSTETYVVGTQKNRPDETVLLCTQKYMFKLIQIIRHFCELFLFFLV